jgi:hypothetical protein
VTRLEAFNKFLSDFARPYTFYTLASASAWAIVKMVPAVQDGYQAAAFAGVFLAGASAIYVSKTFENKWNGQAEAEIRKEEAKAVGQAAAAPPITVEHANLVRGGDPTLVGAADAIAPDRNPGPDAGSAAGLPSQPPGERGSPDGLGQEAISPRA